MGWVGREKKKEREEKEEEKKSQCLLVAQFEFSKLSEKGEKKKLEEEMYSAVERLSLGGTDQEMTTSDMPVVTRSMESDTCSSMDMMVWSGLQDKTGAIRTKTTKTTIVTLQG